MILTLECATGDGTELQLWSQSIPDTLVRVDVNDHSVHLTEEQVIELIGYLETLIVGV